MLLLFYCYVCFLDHRIGRFSWIARTNVPEVMFGVRHWDPHVRSSESSAAPLPWNDSQVHSKTKQKTRGGVVLLFRYHAMFGLLRFGCTCRNLRWDALAKALHLTTPISWNVLQTNAPVIFHNSTRDRFIPHAACKYECEFHGKSSI